MSPTAAGGLIAQAPKTEPDCPMCHVPTESIAFLQPMTATVPIGKNPHASARWKK